MKEKLVEDGVTYYEKHPLKMPRFLTLIISFLLRFAFCRRLTAICVKVMQYTIVIKTIAVFKRVGFFLLRYNLVRGVYEVIRGITPLRLILFLGCISYFYICGMMNMYVSLWKIYESYLYHNIEEFVDTVSMEDPKVVAYLSNRYIVHEPAQDIPRNLKDESMQMSYFEAMPAYRFLNDTKNGFFIEYGAGDGETNSNTLPLELHHNWSGLLIESSPYFYEQLILKRRRVKLSPTCLGSNPYPEVKLIPAVNSKRTFRQWWRDLPPTTTDDHNHAVVQVQCFPLYTYMLALGRMRVDFFSLDNSGEELEVLTNIPWEQVDIRVVSVKQYFFFAKGKTDVLKDMEVPSNKKVLEIYMQRKGYKVYSDDSYFAPVKTTVTVFVKN